MASPRPQLVEALRHTRKALEQLIAHLANKQTKSLSVTEEQQLRRARRALKKINNEYLPWAMLPASDDAKIADIVYKITGLWADLPLEQHQ